jgi:hypothetical protein
MVRTIGRNLSIAPLSDVTRKYLKCSNNTSENRGRSILRLTREQAEADKIANAQGELSPLERGIHALGATEKGKHTTVAASLLMRNKSAGR